MTCLATGRRMVAGVSLVALLALSGCGDDTPDDDPGSPAAAAGETATEHPDTAAAEKITAVYHQWWDAVVQAKNDLNTEAAPFDGLADPILVEEEIIAVKGLAEDDIHRVGEPTLEEPEVTVDGGTARVEGCVDEATWGAMRGDTELPADTRGPTPRIFDFTLQGDSWIISDIVPQKEATISC